MASSNTDGDVNGKKNMESVEVRETQISTTETDGSSHAQTSESKKMRKRADYWNHFEFIDGTNQTKCKCIHCGEIYLCDPKKHETSNPRNHYEYKCKARNDPKQATINLKKGIDGDPFMSNWKFDMKSCRTALAHMVIVDELPF